MTKMLLVGVHGKPHSGKDTIADYIISKYNFCKYGPSVRVKMTAATMFDVPLDCFVDQNKKETIDPFWGISYREMAQKVGKESSRDVFGDDIWMRHVEKIINKFESCNNTLFDDRLETLKIITGIVLADIRYDTEAQWIHDHGGYVIITKRDTAKRGYVANESHPVEHGIDDTFGDYIIDNDETIEDLYKKVDTIVKDIYVTEYYRQQNIIGNG